MRLREIGNPEDAALVEETLRQAVPFRKLEDLAPIVEKIAHSRVVMLGEASHGTHEFYEWREAISRELIEHHGFSFVAVEGDWPPSHQLNKYLHGKGEVSPEAALAHFRRWPTWMWANRETAEFARWLRGFNSSRESSDAVSFYGLDVYSLFESINAVLEHAQKLNPFLARRLRTRYECFDPYHEDETAYARSLLQFPEGCQNDVLKNLGDLLGQRMDILVSPLGEALFNAQQNAHIVAEADNYFRAMVFGNEDSWNVRDRHMQQTLERLLERHGPQSKAIVWAHNTHIGDYRATDMEAQGQINIGGLAREKWGPRAVSLVGFGTFEGSVVASHAWDGPTRRMQVPPGKPGSYEAAFRKVALEKGDNFFLDLRKDDLSEGPLAEVRGHRAIGVIYRPDHEHFGNYVPTSLARRYDAFLFLSRTSALEPFQQDFDRKEIPETWPQGM